MVSTRKTSARSPAPRPRTKKRSASSTARQRLQQSLHLAALLLICGFIGMALFRTAGVVLDGESRLPAILFHGVPLTLLPEANPDFGVFSLTTGLVLRLNLGLVPGLLAGWALHRRFFTPGRKKKTENEGEPGTDRPYRKRPRAMTGTPTKPADDGPGLILASASPRRAELLRTIGLSFIIRPSRVPEIVVPGEAPEDFVLRISRSKARTAGKWNRDQWVVAADTVVVRNGILGKPADREDAARMLRRLSGATHRVVTGVTVLPPGGGEPLSDVAETSVTFLRLSESEIARYVAGGEPDDKAGAYGIQGQAAVFVEHIEGSYSNVVGLPLSLLYQLLLESGYPEDAFDWS